MSILNLDLYLKRTGFKGGTIHDYLANSRIKYFGGQCPIWQVEYFYNNNRYVIGYNYASNGKPILRINEILDN